MAARAEVVLYAGILFLAGLLAAGEGISLVPFSAFGVAAIGAFLLWRKSASGRVSPAYAFLILPLLLGFFYFHLDSSAARVSRILPKTGTAQAVLSGEAARSRSGWILPARLEPPYRGEVKVLSKEGFGYGDMIRLELAGEPEESQSGPPLIRAREIARISPGHGFWLKERLLAAKGWALSRFRAHLPADPAALISGLTFGARADFSPDLSNSMRASGTTHLVALSGYNIGILVLALAAMLRGRLPRRAAFFLVVTGILAFVLMTGGEASIIRAALMAFLVLWAGESGRLYSFGHALVLSAVIMALFDPALIRFDLGFQLSFLSLLGIAYLSGPIAGLMRLKPSSEDILAWKENLATTSAAQLAVLPVLLANFDSFSLSGIFANTLILWFVPLTMFLGFSILFLSALSFYLGQIAAWAVYLLLQYELGVIRFFGWFTLPVGNFLPGWFGAGVYYLVLAAIGLRSAKTEISPAHAR